MKHIIEVDRDTWCGIELNPADWAFVDLPHAEAAIQQDTTVQPCEECLKVARAGMTQQPGKTPQR